jgi:hypothetical protein
VTVAALHLQGCTSRVVSLLRCGARRYNALLARVADGRIHIHDMTHERHTLITIASDQCVRGVVAVSRGFMPSSAAVSGGCAAT